MKALVQGLRAGIIAAFQGCLDDQEAHHMAAFLIPQNHTFILSPGLLLRQ